jgi:hypothetical protein
MILMGYLGGKRPLGRPKHNWVKNINVIVGWQGLDLCGSRKEKVV